MDIRRIHGLLASGRLASARVDGDVGAADGGQDARCVEGGAG